MGIGGAFKPDLVDYGGSAVFDGMAQDIQCGDRRAAAGITTLNHRYVQNLFSRVSGTSFSAPLVAFKAAAILEQFPGSSANFIRALMALSAEIPDASDVLFSRFSDGEKYSVVGSGLPDLESAVFSNDNRVVLTAEDSLEPDKFAIFEIPIPPEFHSTPGRRSIDVALAFDPPVRRTRRVYAGIGMQFDVVRGATEEEVAAAYRAIGPEEDAAKLQGSQKCSLVPAVTLRKSGTLQRAKFTMTRRTPQYGDTYYLVVRCIGKWARQQIDSQRFAVGVMLYHSAEIPLYAKVQERVRIQLRP